MRAFLATALIFSLLATGSAHADEPRVQCVRDGTATQCGWSTVQTVAPNVIVVPDAIAVPDDPRADPVPICIDCDTLQIETTCVLEISAEGKPHVTCEAIAYPSPDKVKAADVD